MTMTLQQIPAEPKALATFKDAMRHLVGGVSVITAGSGAAKTGLTVTSAISLSLDPPTMLRLRQPQRVGLAGHPARGSLSASTSSTRVISISRIGSPGAAG